MHAAEFTNLVELGQVVTYGDVLNLWQIAQQKKSEKNRKPVTGLSTSMDCAKAQVGAFF